MSFKHIQLECVLQSMIRLLNNTVKKSFGALGDLLDLNCDWVSLSLQLVLAGKVRYYHIFHEDFIGTSCNQIDTQKLIISPQQNKVGHNIFSAGDLLGYIVGSMHTSRLVSETILENLFKYLGILYLLS